MQQDRNDAAPGRSKDPRKPSDARLFVIFAFVLGLMLAAYLFIGFRQQGRPRSSRGPSESAHVSPDAQAEVLKAFRNLQLAADRIYRNPSEALLESVYVPDGPTWRRVNQDLRTLQESDVRFIRRNTTKQLELLSLTSSEAVLRHTLVSDGVLLDSKGKDVSRRRSPEHQVIKWVLRTQRGEWRIYKGTIVRADQADDSQ